MSSDLFVFDSSFFSDPFSPLLDSHPQFPYEILDNSAENDERDQIASALLSSSPPSVQLESLSLSQLESAAYSGLEVKSEDFQLHFGGSLAPSEAATRFMQRSFSSNSFENKQSFSFRPQFGGVWEPQNQVLDSAEGSGHMRRACSTGDLQNVKSNVQTRNVLSSSADKSLMEEASFKVGKYSAEERKGRIDRYRAKRTQRNFNKTIKYACRKALADNRPRIRGRFARNDDAGEIPKAYHRYEDEDDLWIHGFYEEDEEESIRRWALFNGSVSGSGSIHYQNYSY